MADNLDTPVPDGSTIATDEVDGAHVQFTKLLDGTDGSGNRLVVESNGALRRPMTVIEFAGFPTITQDTGYTDGDVVGTPVDLGLAPPGIAVSMELAVASFAGLTLPDLDVFVIQAPSTAVPADFGTDGDPLVTDLSVAGSVLGSGAAGFAPMDYEPKVVTWHTSVPRQITDNASDDPVRWILLLRAAETFADDLTGGVVVFGWAEHATHATLPLT